MFVILSLAEGMVVLRNVLNAIYNIKLKWLLALMLAFITLLAIAMNIIYYFVSSNSLEVQAQAYFSNVCSNLEYNINAVNDNTKKSWKAFATSRKYKIILPRATISTCIKT